MQKIQRLLALDVFRGLTIAMMIVVNDPGHWDHVYAPLLHSKWIGCTPTDLVFPFFMFIMGAAMWYSFKKTGHRITWPLTLKILRRSLIIYLIGVSISWYAQFNLDFSHLRIMGVLNRIAIAYALASFIVLTMKYRNVILTTIIILLGYWAILVLFGQGHPFLMEDNFAGRFDALVLGANHLPGYHGALFDQTGLMATLPSIGSVLLGTIAGRIIDKSETMLKAVKSLLFFGTSAVILAQVWSLVFPIIKPLWTSSYVLYTAGLAMLFLGILLWVIDIRGYTKWSMPFRVFGLNPLFLYAFAEYLQLTFNVIYIHSSSGEKTTMYDWLYSSVFQPIAGDINGSLLYAICFTAVCWLAGYVLYRKKIIIKI